jgi:hypothetical protein
VALESEKKKRLKVDASDTHVMATNLRVRYVLFICNFFLFVYFLSNFLMPFFSYVSEDRAKYLINLDPTSASYDPKSRSMRDNPNEGKDDTTVTFTGDNASKQTGEMGEFYSLQKYAWEEYGAV